LTAARTSSTVTPPRPFEIGPIARGETVSAARALGAAFLDDPVSTAIGPHRRSHRRISGPVSFMGIVIACRRHGGTILVARDQAGGVLGVSIAFKPDAWPITEGAIAYELGWLLIAGPLPARRGVEFDRMIRGAHPTHRHIYLWFLGVDPIAQSRGIGRALLAKIHADSAELDVPTYLETGTMANVAYYASLGYETVGELTLPCGPQMWRMERK
jgi:ribosomal protein S18 acetylase RimI-like enzyme